jgi:D-alanyl-lipoteichoic acid acyltransferase DltB (MBOAT superfamily)
MRFNSTVFLQFFAAFLLLYWLVRNHRSARNALIVAGSFLFYAWWTPPQAATPAPQDFLGGLTALLWQCRFLGLLVLTSLVDFSVGLLVQHAPSPARRKTWLTLSIVSNLAVLGFFKYCDFFITSVAGVLEQLGFASHPHTLGWVLPVGISFYTFQSMSYVIDVYRRELPATRNLTNFLAFVSFFPQLVAGPIERARHLLPQFDRELVITRAMLTEGVWLILWGLFKKVALADNFAPLADLAYGQDRFTAPVVLMGTTAFALQIYCDFSAYSDIARGTARLLGFDIMWNFKLPYFAPSIREFWRRWHISLSTWLRDYLYIPLGGNRHGATRTYCSLLATMLLGGLWHGAAWHFVLFGAWHGIGLAVHRALHHRWPAGNHRGSRALSWSVTMLFVLFGWLLFRAESWNQIQAMTLALTDWAAPPWLGAFSLNLLGFATPLVALELMQARSGDLLLPLRWPSWTRTAFYGLLLWAIVIFWRQQGTPFIYFQF